MNLDRLKTEMQETGECTFPDESTLADLNEVVSDLGLDPRKVEVGVDCFSGSVFIYLAEDPLEDGEELTIIETPWPEEEFDTVPKGRVLQPPCIDNPKTGKPYTRHDYKETDLRVATYSMNAFGGMSPHSYSYTLTCRRCGFQTYGSY